MKKETDNMKKCIIALIILDIVGASIGVFARILEKSLLLFQQVSFRLLSAFFIINIVFYKNIDYKKLKEIPRKDWVLITLRAILMYLLGITIATIAFSNGKYNNVSFIMALPMTAILGIIILKEKVNLHKTLLILLSFLGVTLISTDNFRNIFSWI